MRSGARGKVYAGVGSRDTPQEILEVMTRLAGQMEQDGWRLRSGGARGADSAFEAGVVSPTNRAIYLPWDGYEGRAAGRGGYYDSQRLPGWSGALETVRQYHPAPDRLGRGGLSLMARNAMQVLGPDLGAPADLLVAWTPGARFTGGTGQALRMAADKGIPIRNLADPVTLEGVLRYLDRPSSRPKVPVSPGWSNQVGAGYEVSTRGDSRFSALRARLPDGRIIEDAWGQAKGYPDGRAAKNRPALAPNFDYWGTYKGLWSQWADANPALMAELAQLSQGLPLVDRFARTENNQARALSELLAEREWSAPQVVDPDERLRRIQMMNPYA